MSLVLGVDGGQTTIRVRLSGDDREIDLDGVGRQDRDAIDAVAAAVDDAWRRLDASRLDRVVLGLSTAPADAATSDRLAASIARALDVPEVWVTDDAVTAHAGALSGRPGVSIVCGTGVACLAMSIDQVPRIIGGHGFLLGDEGGGFWIGRNGLRAALRAVDGRGSATALVSAAERRFGSLDDLHVRLHDMARPIPVIAAFAPDVIQAADDGDQVAEAVVRDAVDELLLLVRAGIDWIGSRDMPVALGGRLLADGSGLRRRLEAQDPSLDLVDPGGSPLDGAILLGLGGDPGPYRELIHEWRGSTP